MKTLESDVSKESIERLIEGRAAKLYKLIGDSAVTLYQQYGIDGIAPDEAAAMSGLLYGERAITPCPVNSAQQHSADEIMRTRILLTEVREDATPRDKALFAIYRLLREQHAAELRQE